MDNEKGFSLMELMTVVVVIGILTTIAVPQYTKMRRKSFQSNGKANLTKIFAKQKFFITQWGYATTNFHQMGFYPEGDLWYNIGWKGGHRTAKIDSGECTGNCDINTEDSTKKPSMYGGPLTTDSKDVNTATYCNGHWDSKKNAPDPATASNECSVERSTGSIALGGVSKQIENKMGKVKFSIGMVANFVGGLVADQDQWTLNQDKELKNVQNGL